MRLRQALPTLVLVLVAAVPFSEPARGQDPGEPGCRDSTDDINDVSVSGGVEPPESISGFNQIDIRFGCVEETLATIDLTILLRGNVAPQDGQLWSYTASLRIAGGSLSCTVLASSTSARIEGCGGAKANISFASVKIEIPRGTLGFAPGAPISDLFFATSGTFRGSFTGADRAPDQGANFTGDNPLRVGARGPFTLDADADGVPDRIEISGLTDLQHPDTDRDGLVDGPDLRLKTNDPRVARLESFGLVANERNDTIARFFGESEFGTAPLNPDTDGDGLLDGWNVTFTLERSERFAKLIVAPIRIDATPAVYAGEKGHRSDPREADTDGDLLSDREELLATRNLIEGSQGFYPLLAGSTDPGSRDTDNDGLNDTEEVEGRAQLGGVDRTFSITDPNSRDSDGDGLTDFDETIGQTIPLGREPINFSPSDPRRRDTDDDGYDDLAEALGRSDPTDATSLPRSWTKLWWAFGIVLVIVVAVLLVGRFRR